VVGGPDCRARLTAARHGPLRFSARVPQHRSVSLCRFGFCYHTRNAEEGNGISPLDHSGASSQPGQSSAGTSAGRAPRPPGLRLGHHRGRLGQVHPAAGAQPVAGRPRPPTIASGPKHRA